ncbi:hypothetical protein [uncultured Helicobacter sp.]|uniref:hypothetical protein n=1 Tax=uncultured Helicobacter sp. TaxID=175537 RepID=UPI00261C80DE|nr:hypothetical protein [uncultured Helicobacter sp.]
MELRNNLLNAFETYADNIAIEVENRSLTYANLQSQSFNLIAFLKAKNGGGGAK